MQRCLTRHLREGAGIERLLVALRPVNVSSQHVALSEGFNDVQVTSEGLKIGVGQTQTMPPEEPNKTRAWQGWG